MTKRIFQSIVIVATLVLFVCFGVTLGILYDHYSDLQWQQLGIRSHSMNQVMQLIHWHERR